MGVSVICEGGATLRAALGIHELDRLPLTADGAHMLLAASHRTHVEKHCQERQGDPYCDVNEDDEIHGVPSTRYGARKF